MSICSHCDRLDECRQAVMDGSEVLCEPSVVTPVGRFCVDCDKNISRGAIRCRHCEMVRRWQDRTKNEKRPVSDRCVECGAPLKGFGVRCSVHASLHSWRIRRGEVQDEV